MPDVPYERFPVAFLSLDDPAAPMEPDAAVAEVERVRADAGVRT